MKSKKVLGWFVAGLGIILLLLGILSDARINLGPLNYLYSLLEFVSIRNFISLLAESISFFFRAIGKYFFYIVLIVVGLTIIFANKKANEETIDFDEEGRPIYKRKLQRSLRNRKLMGVCFGLSQYLHIDVTIIRLLFVFTFIIGGGISGIVYIVLAINMPETNEY